MTIRPVCAADRTVYGTLADEFYHTDAVLSPVPAAYFDRTFDEVLRSDTYALAYLFEEAGQPVGYALLSRTFSQEAGGMVIWVEELYLRPAFRGKGGGHAFFAYLQAHTDAVRYRLEVEPENERAVRLYREMGFEVLPYGQMVKHCPR